MARDRSDARALASSYGIRLDSDYHALSHDQVERITAAADSWNYRKPANANGSRARYFHAYLQRLANRPRD